MELFYYTRERIQDSNGVSKQVDVYNPIKKEQISFKIEECICDWDNYKFPTIALVPYYKGVKLQLAELIPAHKSFRGESHYKRMNSIGVWNAISPEYQTYFNLPKLSYYA